MKYSSILLAAALGASVMTSIGCVVAPVESGPGSYRDREYASDTGSDYRGKVHRLREHYNRVAAEADRVGAGPEVREHLRDIDQGIHRVASFVFSGEFNPDRAQENISRLHEELRQVSDHLR